MIDRRTFLSMAGALSLSCHRRGDDAASIELFRTFGGCNDAYGGVTDLSTARGECGVIQVLVALGAAARR